MNQIIAFAIGYILAPLGGLISVKLQPTRGYVLNYIIGCVLGTIAACGIVYAVT